MKETEQKNNFTLQNIKEKGTGLLTSAGSFLDNAISIFKKDESTMNTEEKVEKQHMLNFIYGMGAGVIVYHFLIGAVLLLGIIWFYNLSLKKTKTLINEKTLEVTPVKKRAYKRRKPAENESKE